MISMEPLLWTLMAMFNLLTSTELGMEFWVSLASTVLPFLPHIFSFIFHLLNIFQEILLHSKFSFKKGVSFNGLIQVQLNLFQRFVRGSLFLFHGIICSSSSLINFCNPSLILLVFTRTFSNAENPLEDFRMLLFRDILAPSGRQLFSDQRVLLLLLICWSRSSSHFLLPSGSFCSSSVYSLPFTSMS